MKLKSSAIAVAVAGALGASMTAQAESGFYADLRIGFQNTDTGGNSELQIQNQVSRFGFRGSTDMGNGLTGFGRMEFGLNTEGGAQDTVDLADPAVTNGATERPTITRRHAYVGLSGDWGQVLLGQSYHTFYNFISGPLDNPMLGTAPDTTIDTGTWLGYTGRTAQALSYSGEWGIFSLGVTGYFDSSSNNAAGNSPNDLDGYELAGAFQAGPINLAIGVKASDDIDGVEQEPLIGLLASGWQTGMFTWGLGYNMQDEEGGGSGDAEAIIFDVLIGNGYIHYEQTEWTASDGTSFTPTNITFAYMQSLGRQTSMYYEYQIVDADTDDSDDDADVITVALRYQWK
jgi:predicted porin